MNGDPGVVQHGGPRLDFGERAVIYKAYSRTYPRGRCQCILSTKRALGVYFFILDVIPQVIYMHMVGEVLEVSCLKEHSERNACLLDSKAESYHELVRGAGHRAKRFTHIMRLMPQSLHAVLQLSSSGN